ncbi:hypothetical protein [Phenylobacterium soli]|uniref:Lipoprotein n=1 Tax=Phenylobacterium soli TaxID=2170551 RepID=A0A328AHN4_9CAUL|nr:hypothetical protein [Phenylobacterium soli]RAK54159.1 hypothetical protein DJ017_06320 [Phenylobacterium soli]
MKPALNPIVPAACLLVAFGLTACSRRDAAPTPAHSEVAASMPDAATTPGAQGPATAAPHAPPPATNTLSDRHPEPGAPAANATNTQ